MAATTVLGLLATLFVAPISATSDALPAIAATTFDCTSVYSLRAPSPNNYLMEVDPGTGVATNVGRFDNSGSTTNLNALGFTGDGRRAIAAGQTGTYLLMMDPDGTTTALVRGLPNAAVNVTHGAVNTAANVYYYGGFSGSTAYVYGYDLGADEYLGLVARGSVPGGNNGDWAFDSTGYLYVIAGGNGGNTLSVVKQQLPTTSQPQPRAITGETLTTINTPNNNINGIAFGGDGYLYMASGTTWYQANPSTGQVISQRALTGDNRNDSGDLGSCASPNTISVRKAFPEGRVDAADQVTLEVTGGGITRGNRATTSGSKQGVQDDPAMIAGPVIGLGGETYRVTESGAGADERYVRSWRCVDTNSNRELARGGGTSGEFVLPSGSAVVCTFTNDAQRPSVGLTKTAGTPTDVNDNGITDAGDTIAYEFLVENTGNTILTDPTVDDPKLGAVTCPAVALEPGESVSCTAPVYTITADDEDAGSVDNTATAAATPPNGLPQVSSRPSSTSTPVERAAPALAIEKSAEPQDAASYQEGQEITYSFVVRNTGNVTVADIDVTESDFSGTGTLSALSCPADRTLAPNTSFVCTASYTLTQADVDAGEVTNAATASGDAPDGAPVDAPEDTARIPVEADPQIALEKSVTPSAPAGPGETVTYEFVITNTGNVSLTDPTIDETAFGGSGAPPEVSCPSGVLRPGEVVICTASYVITQTDADAGGFENTATATAIPPAGSEPPVSAPSTAEVAIAARPDLDLRKSASPETIGRAGETVTYSFEVTNRGNVTLRDLEVAEGQFSGTGELSAIDCPVTSLAAGETTTCTATYQVTQEDVDTGTIANSATVGGTSPNGETVPSPPSRATVDAPPSPAVELEKLADPTTASAAGATIQYDFVVRNTGNVTLHELTIDENDFSGSGQLSAITCPGDALAPGAEMTCHADYTLSQDDVDAGVVTNTATARGNSPTNEETSSSPANAIVTIEAAPSLTLVKSADRTELRVGEEITYTFVIENTGNVTLTGVTVNDTGFTGSGSLSEISCPDEASALKPGAQIDCSASYTVTQADVDRGTIDNTATATGTPPSGREVTTPPSEVRIPQDPQPSLTLAKSVDPGSATAAGTTVTYTFNVRNTGNVTLHEIGIDEQDFSGTGSLSAIECPAAPLAPGGTTRCTASYTITQADVDAGTITNTAAAHGTPPRGGAVDSDPDEAEVVIPPAPSLQIVKSADTTELVAGETITYSFVVSNTGNVTLHEVAVSEGDFSGAGELSEVVCRDDAGQLAPGAQLVCSATYVVQQADVDRGTLENTATAQATSPGGEAVESDPSDVRIPQDPQPGLTLLKTADADRAAKAGQRITYSFAITNTGNVTLRDVTVQEGEFSGAGALGEPVCPDEAAALLPGRTVVCTAVYTVVEADLSGAPLTNTAIASGIGPGASDRVFSGFSTALVPTAKTESPGLATTGVSIAVGLIVLAALLLIGGALVLVLRARRAAHPGS
ncbi:hypothetical protein GCM10009857_34540 [Agromyces soli]